MSLIDGYDFDGLIDAIEQEVIDYLTVLANRIIALAAVNTPVQTGMLRNGYFWEIVKENDELILRIGNGANYFFYVEKGTGELAENGMGRKGGWYYEDEQGVWHHVEKGSKAYNMLTNAVEEIMGQM